MGHPLHVKEFVGTINDYPWGRTFYVHSTHTNASDSNLGIYPRQPLKTLVQAYANCLAGDRIIIGPNHAETITAATTFGTADMRVIGLGNGPSRPTFTFTTVVGSHFTVIGDNNVFENLRFLCGIDAQTILLTFGSPGGKLLNCDFGHSGAVQPLIAVDINVPYVEVGHCSCTYLATGLNTVVNFQGAADNIHIHDCRFSAVAATGIIVNDSAAADDILIERNSLQSLNTTAKPCVLGKSATTGVIRHNTMRLGQDVQTGWIATPGECSLFENYGVNNDGETGILAGTPSV